MGHLAYPSGGKKRGQAKRVVYKFSRQGRKRPYRKFQSPIVTMGVHSERRTIELF